MYTRTTRSERLADRFPQLATNDDRPNHFQAMRDDLAGYTAEQIKLREQCDFVDTLTQGTEKDMHFKNTVNFIYSRDFATGYTCGYNDGKTEMIPDRRKTPRTPGRHGMDRLAVSEQHKDALTRVKTW